MLTLLVNTDGKYLHHCKKILLARAVLNLHDQYPTLTRSNTNIFIVNDCLSSITSFIKKAREPEIGFFKKTICSKR